MHEINPERPGINRRFFSAWGRTGIVSGFLTIRHTEDAHCLLFLLFVAGLDCLQHVVE